MPEVEKFILKLVHPTTVSFPPLAAPRSRSALSAVQVAALQYLSAGSGAYVGVGIIARGAACRLRGTQHIHASVSKAAQHCDVEF